MSIHQIQVHFPRVIDMALRNDFDRRKKINKIFPVKVNQLHADYITNNKQV